jgi:hypothetical protein
MANQTIYDIRLRYLLDDKASKGLGKIADEGNRAAHSAGVLDGVLGKIGALVVGTFGAREAGKALIGFNSDLEQAKITMAGMIQLNLGGTWAKNMATANGLVGDFQTMAKASVGTTKDFVDMAQLIVRPITAAGGSMEDLKTATQGAVIAGRSFGKDAEYVSRDIESALAGNLGKKDMFARALLEPRGFTTTSWNAMVAKDPSKGIKELIKALNDPAIKDMAKAQENSFAGVTSTFTDNLQMAIGKVGLPLFKEITKEVQSWNTWIDKNQDKVKEISESLAHGLVEGFHMVKDAIAFLISHKDTLIMIAKLWLAAKAGGMVGNMLGAFGGGGAGMFGALGSSPFSKGAGGIAGTSQAMAFAAMGGWELGQLLNKEVPEIQETFTSIDDAIGRAAGLWDEHTRGIVERMDAVEKSMSDMDAAIAGAAAKLKGKGGMYELYLTAASKAHADDLQREAQRRRLSDANVLQYASGTGAAAARGALATGKYVSTYDAAQAAADKQSGIAAALPNVATSIFGAGLATLNQTQLDALDMQKAQVKILELVNRSLQTGTPIDMKSVDKILKETTLSGSDRTRSGAKAAKPNVHVTIQRIEVQSDDPDRFAFGLVESFRDAARNPGQAFDTLREA